MPATSTTTQPPKWYRDWLAWLLIGSMVYGIACTYGLASDVGRPFPGFRTFFNTTAGEIAVEKSTPTWWWFGTDDRAGIFDELIEMDGVPFKNLTGFFDEAVIYEDAQAENRGIIPATVRRDGVEMVLNVHVQTFSWIHFWDIKTAPIVISLCLWVLSLILYRAAPFEHVQRLTATALLMVALVVIGTNSFLFQSNQSYTHFLVYNFFFQAVFFPLAGALFLHLAIDFPFQHFTKKLRVVRKIFLIAIYTTAIARGVCFIVSRVLIWNTGITPFVQTFDKFSYKSSLYLVAAATVFFMARLILDVLFFAKEPRHKREALIVFISVFIALPALWLTVYSGFGETDVVLLMQSLADARYFFLAIPFAFAALTLRYHTFDGAENWMLFVLLLAISGFATNVSMMMLFSQEPELILDLAVPVQPMLFFTFFGVSFFWSRQNRWNGWLGNVFQWERVNYSAVHQFGEALAGTSYQNAEQLGGQISTILCEELNLECAAVWMGDGSVSSTLGLTAVSGTWISSPPKTLTPSTETFSPQRLQANSPDWLAVLPDNAAVILPLKSANQLLGAMVVGKRWDSAVFDERDLTVLSLIAQQATALLHNAQQLEALRAADKQMLQIQTSTQQKIARNLHDYILPALGRFPMQIESSLRYLDEDQEKSKQILQESVEQLGETAVQLRRIQQDLIIRPMEYGLSPYLLDLTQQFTADTGIPITLMLPPETDKTISDTATREVVYAVWRQALDNVAAHAHATRINIKLTITDEIHFSIEDDGIGTTEEQRAQAATNGRFGLKSMQTRLEGVNGRFRFQSQLKQGSTVEGWLPLM